MFNKKLKFKGFVCHRSGAVAALEGPKDVTEHIVRFVCDLLEMWCFGVCVSASVKTRLQRSLCRMLLSGQGSSRRFRETRPGIRMEVWVTVNQVETFLFEMYADYNCNSDKFPAELLSFSWMVKHAAWTLTRYALTADGQTSFYKLMSKDYHREVAKFSELVWFRIPAKQPKLGEQWRKAHWVGKSERSDEHLLAMRGSTFSARAFGESHVMNSGIWRVSKL